MEKKKPRFKLPSIVRWIGWVLLVQFILVNISAALYAYRLTHVSDDPALRNSKPSGNIFVKTWRLFSGPRQAKSQVTSKPTFPYQTVQLKTASGIYIEAWYAAVDSAARGTVILFHGISANKGMIINEAADFRYQGFNVMLVDFRAHGNSGGQTTTIGVREAEEVQLAYTYVTGRGEKNIFLWGASMGAVVVARAIAQYELHPSGVILEMPFASLQTHLQARARTLGFPGFPEKPFGFFVSWWMGIERGFNGWGHQTTRYVKKITCPVLLQWGALDNYVLQRETQRIYDALPGGKKRWVIYEQAGHESLLGNEPEKWRRETAAFFAEALQSQVK